MSGDSPQPRPLRECKCPDRARDLGGRPDRFGGVGHGQVALLLSSYARRLCRFGHVLTNVRIEGGQEHRGMMAVESGRVKRGGPPRITFQEKRDEY